MALTQFGCATKSKELLHRQLPPPPSEEVRAHLGTIGLLMTQISTNQPLKSPPSGGAGTAAGAGAGALEGLVAGAQGGPLGALFLWPILVPVGAVAGGFSGHAQEVPGAKVKETEQRLRAAMSQMDLAQRLPQEFAHVMQAQTSHPSVMVTNSGAGLSSGGLTYCTLTNQGIDTVLELQFLGSGLKGFHSGKKEPLAAFLATGVNLVRARDGALLYTHVFVTEGGQRPFLDWAKNDARPLREELTRLLPQQVQTVVEELFLVYDPRQYSAK